MTSSWRIWRGGVPADGIDPGDRGLAYGDGLFETLLVHQGKPVWWEAHARRLARGCETLRIDLPDPSHLRAQAEAIAAGCERGVLKLILTRGSGERGYALPAAPQPLLAIGLSDAPPPAPREGLVLRWCDTTLAIQPRLAGIKHLNRLEQVLARAEWSDPAIHEGLQCDTAGRVVGATSANLFVLRAGRWLTPPVADCGIAGVCRGWLLEHVPGAGEAVLARADVESADALVLCNAVRDILPVAALGTRHWATHEAVLGLVRMLASAEPAFTPARLS